MDPMMDEAEDEQSDSLSQQDVDQEPAASGEGYQLVLKVTPAGLSVCKKPLSDSSPGYNDAKDQTTYDEIDVENMEQALKAILLLYKQNPVGATEEAAMQAAYGKGGA